jgi:hypothetical protein
MPLEISWDYIEDLDEPPSWLVGVRFGGCSEIAALVWGFARRKDAELGMKAISDTGIDWSDQSAAGEQAKERAGSGDRNKIRQWLRRIACEALQW